MGCRKIVAGLALVAPFLILSQPMHAKAEPSAQAPLAACSLAKIADRSDDGYVDDGHTGDGEVPRVADRLACDAGTDIGVSAPDKTVFFTPVLSDHEDLEDDTTIPVRHLSRRPTLRHGAI